MKKITQEKPASFPPKRRGGNVLWVFLVLLILCSGFVGIYAIEPLVPTYKDEIRFHDTTEENDGMLLLDDSNRITVKPWDSFDANACIPLRDATNYAGDPDISGQAMDNILLSLRSLFRLMGNNEPSPEEELRLAESILISMDMQDLYINWFEFDDGTTLRFAAEIYNMPSPFFYHRSASKADEAFLEKARKDLLEDYSEVRELLIFNKPLSESGSPLASWLQSLADFNAYPDTYYDAEASGYSAEMSSSAEEVPFILMEETVYTLYTRTCHEIGTTDIPAVIPQDGELLLIFSDEKETLILYYNPIEEKITGFAMS